jgi:thymidylate synthase ThyX
MSIIDRLDNAVKELQEIRDQLKREAQADVPTFAQSFEQAHYPRVGGHVKDSKGKLFVLTPVPLGSGGGCGGCGGCALDEHAEGCAACTMHDGIEYAQRHNYQEVL